jgi:DNA-directed RNA polymerase-3 subunit RPC5
MSADPTKREDEDMPDAGPSTSADATTSIDLEMADPNDDENNFIPPARPVYAEPHLPPNLVDDDDEIAHTLPIFISHALDPSIHLFQYPLNHRPVAVSQYAKEHGEVITARMKEQVRRLEIEIPVDQRGEVWNEERAETFGFAEEDEKEKKKSKGKSKEQEKIVWGTKMRLRGEEVPGVTGYWSGIVHDG